MTQKEKGAIERLRAVLVDDGFQGTTTLVLSSANGRARQYISLSTAMHGHSPLPLRTTDATSGHAIGTAVSHEQAMPITQIIGSVNLTEDDDTLDATGKVGPAPHDRPESCAELLDRGIAPKSMRLAETPGPSPIAMPPGYVMARIAAGVFFFSRSMPRAVEEAVGDYRTEMTDAEARGKSPSEIRTLRAKHWAGFVICVIEALLTGSIGRIWRALRGG
jgi:hypothetical protein